MTVARDSPPPPPLELTTPGTPDDVRSKVLSQTSRHRWESPGVCGGFGRAGAFRESGPIFNHDGKTFCNLLLRCFTFYTSG